MKITFDSEIDEVANLARISKNQDLLCGIWQSVSQKIIGGNYANEIRPLLQAFVANPNTPNSILEGFMFKYGSYGHGYMGIEPEIMEACAEHPNINPELAKNYLNNKDLYSPYSQEYFEETLQAEQRAMEALKDADLRMHFTDANVVYLSNNLASIKFDPEKVEKIGIDYLMRYILNLRYPQYNPDNGVVIGKTVGNASPYAIDFIYP